MGSDKDRVQLSMPQIQNATLAGGTAMSTTVQGSTDRNRSVSNQDLRNLDSISFQVLEPGHNQTSFRKFLTDQFPNCPGIPAKASMPVHPGGALLIGFIGGIVSTLGFRYSQVLKSTGGSPHPWNFAHFQRFLSF